jgi:hypothetical protein
LERIRDAARTSKSALPMAAAMQRHSGPVPPYQSPIESTLEFFIATIQNDLFGWIEKPGVGRIHQGFQPCR